MGEQGKPLHPLAGVLGDVEDRAEALLDGVAQQLGNLVDVALGEQRELVAENLLDLGDGCLVERAQVVIDAADTKHGKASRGQIVAPPWMAHVGPMNCSYTLILTAVNRNSLLDRFRLSFFGFSAYDIGQSSSSGAASFVGD